MTTVSGPTIALRRDGLPPTSFTRKLMAPISLGENWIGSPSMLEPACKATTGPTQNPER